MPRQLAQMLSGRDFNEVPGIQPAPQVGSIAGTVQAPRTNGALQLAASLAEFSPEARRFTLNYADKLRDEATAEAKAAALKTAGESFGEAVRKGLIEHTQNPWFIQAYNRDAAAVKSQRGLADINAQATQWEEQRDPKLFQERWAREVSGLGNHQHWLRH